MKPNKSYRIDPKLIEKANKIGLPIVDIFEAALASTLLTRECPYCRQDFDADRKLDAVLTKIEAWATAGNVMHSKKLMDALEKIADPEGDNAEEHLE